MKEISQGLLVIGASWRAGIDHSCDRGLKLTYLPNFSVFSIPSVANFLLIYATLQFFWGEEKFSFHRFKIPCSRFDIPANIVHLAPFRAEIVPHPACPLHWLDGRFIECDCGMAQQAGLSRGNLSGCDA